MKPLKIVQILSRLNVGGTASHVIYVTRGLRDRGHEVSLISGREDPDEGNMLSLAEENRVKPILIDCFRRPIAPLLDLATIWRIWRLLRRLKPHVVHTHASKAGVLGRIAAILARVPIRIHTFHGHVLQEYFSPRVSKVFIRIERILARRSAAIIGVSREVCDQLVKMGVVDRQRVRHIGIGLELDQYLECDRYQGVLKAEFGIPEEVPLVGIIARLVPIKGYEVFLKAARIVWEKRQGNVRFVIVGDGFMRSQIQADVQKAGLSEVVHFAGFRENLVPVYADLDVVALSSHNEGTPVTLIEAAAAGRPGVATRVGGVPELIEDGFNGFLVDKGDASALAGKIEWLLDHPDQAREMGLRGRDRVMQSFSTQRLLKDLEALYDQIAQEKQIPRK